jgi:hypothetical protein
MYVSVNEQPATSADHDNGSKLCLVRDFGTMDALFEDTINFLLRNWLACLILNIEMANANSKPP